MTGVGAELAGSAALVALPCLLLGTGSGNSIAVKISILLLLLTSVLDFSLPFFLPLLVIPPRNSKGSAFFTGVVVVEEAPTKLPKGSLLDGAGSGLTEEIEGAAPVMDDDTAGLIIDVGAAVGVPLGLDTVVVCEESTADCLDKLGTGLPHELVASFLALVALGLTAENCTAVVVGFWKGSEDGFAHGSALLCLLLLGGGAHGSALLENPSLRDIEQQYIAR